MSESEYGAAFAAFQASGGRAALSAQLRSLEELAARAAAQDLEIPPELGAIIEGLQRLLASLDELAATAHPDARAPEEPPEG
jgi:hypothetical protein